MANEIKKYCESLDCAICDEKEPCIYKIANDLEKENNKLKEEVEQLKQSKSSSYDDLDSLGCHGLSDW